ncbi:crotonase/enoyl-CoA hydratase family protein [Emcibacter sp. SYSU 3D8]|uniref:crotonase/enoyl-CoA hydratase family protein n=1 Tax=Emcibacter sp. SYSU 3D8 TaxID=3133969 RepID=UPI0031FE9DC4
MIGKAVKLEVKDQIAHVILNRPDAFNSLNPDFWVEFPAAFEAIEARDDVRVVVLSSTGKHFCAGLDLNSFKSLNAPNDEDEGRKREAFRRHLLDLHDRIGRLEKCRYPVLAAIQGACVGGGLDITVCADMRYCTRDAFFVVQEVNIGMAPDLGTLQRLPRLIPAGIARELAFTGRRMYGDEAKDVGYVNQVFETHDSMLEAVMEIARAIAGKSPLAVHGSKELMNYARDHSVADSLNYVAIWTAATLVGGGDLREGVAAFREKRSANYANLHPVSANRRPHDD